MMESHVTDYCKLRTVCGRNGVYTLAQIFVKHKGGALCPYPIV